MDNSVELKQILQPHMQFRSLEVLPYCLGILTQIRAVHQKSLRFFSMVEL